MTYTQNWVELGTGQRYPLLNPSIFCQRARPGSAMDKSDGPGS